LSAFADARTVPSGTTIETDIAIIGAGAAGITLALSLARKSLRVLLLESGGGAFDSKTQALYAGIQTGVPYLKLNASRMRFLGGSTNHWGGWCRPLDVSDFDARPWLAHSGWPFPRSEIEPYFPHAQAWVEAGPLVYDADKAWFDTFGAPLKLGDGGVYTSFFQFSKMRGSVLPTNFGERYEADLKREPNLSLLLHANITNIALSNDAQSVDHLKVATLSGRSFTVKPKYTVLATGGIENARMLLASNDVMSAGIGNGNDLVGRYFADHAIPRDTATLVLFDGNLAPYYQNNQTDKAGTIFRATLAPTDGFKKAKGILDSLATIEGNAPLDDLGKAAIAANASSMNVDASNAKALSVGCGFELSPDPDRRFTLINERDALGMPRLQLHMTLADSDYQSYRATLKELGRQLLESRIGMIRLDRATRDEWLSVMDWGNHHMGTTRMSTDPKTGVVDPNSQVFGVSNLYVAGSSVFPTYGASNPTMNLVALTLRLANHLKGLFT
jgi:choline dehydrogenase-like flavoprotein